MTESVNGCNCLLSSPPQNILYHLHIFNHLQIDGYMNKYNHKLYVESLRTILRWIKKQISHSKISINQ